MKSPHHISPPRWATWFLRWYCPDILLEEIEGDLLEAFDQNCEQIGIAGAKFFYVLDAIRFLNPTTFQKARFLSPYTSHPTFIRLAMLKHYFLLIRRNVRRYPFYALLNISGLTLGIAATLFILLYLDFELNFDRFHEQKDQIYRLYTPVIETHNKRMEVDWGQVPAPLGPVAKQDYPEIKDFTRFYSLFFNTDLVTFQYQDQRIRQQEGVWATDSSTVHMFTFDWIEGGAMGALDAPHKIILSESLARRIFGEAKALGKTLEANLVNNSPDIPDTYPLLVTGVYRDFPPNSHIQMEALISAYTDPQLEDYYYNRFSFNTYLMLHPDVDPVAFAPKLSEIYEKYLDVDREPVLARAIHDLVPLTGIHMRATSGLSYTYIFGGIGLLLLLIVSISYVNLATAQASRRAMEVGLRKVLGSQRKNLIVQFLSESLFFTLLGLMLGVVLVVVSIEPVNQILGLQLRTAQLKTPQLWLGLGAILVLLGILGGSYPAFFLSSFQPIKVLKGRYSKASSRAPLRKALIGVQFAIVMFVLICTAMIYDQLQYMRKKDLGFEREHVVYLSLSGQNDAQQISLFQHTLAQSPYILSTSTTSFLPGQGMGRRPVSVETPEGPKQQFVHFGSITEGFWETMDIELVSGRNFSPNFPTDTTSGLIVNEALLRNFGVTDPIGTKIRMGDEGNPHFYQIVGVVKDFHQSSLHTPIESQIFFLQPASNLLVRVGQDLPGAMDQLKSSWENIFPNADFQYTFLNDILQEAYVADQVRGKIFFFFSLLTLLICFLGLFGLAAYLSSQRIKEIGIRKILGARVKDIVLLITRDFLILVLLAVLPAFIGAWFVGKQWLENFVFRTEINYGFFLGVLVFTLGLTLMVTGLHALRAAQLNPAGSLRHE